MQLGQHKELLGACEVGQRKSQVPEPPVLLLCRSPEEHPVSSTPDVLLPGGGATAGIELHFVERGNKISATSRPTMLLFFLRFVGLLNAVVFVFNGVVIPRAASTCTGSGELRRIAFTSTVQLSRETKSPSRTSFELFESRE